MKNPEKPPKWEGVLRNPGRHLDLSKLLQNNELSRMIKDSQMKYLYWEELKYHFPNPPCDHKTLWAIIKLFRAQQYKAVKIGNLDFKYYLTELAQEKLHFADSHAGQIIGSESPLDRFQTGERKRYLINSLMEEAIASSQLEGAMTTRKVAKEMLRTKRKPKNKNEKMIYNNYQTMKYIKELFEPQNLKKNELTTQIILAIHQQISHETLKNPQAEGKFRTTDDIIVGDDTGEIKHVPPSYSKVPGLVEDLCKFANDVESPFIHPLVKAIILHFLIGYIHPFEDGNGRTARALFYWYCMKSGYWTFEYLPISRIIKKAPSKYGRAYLYTEYDDLDMNYFIHFNLYAIKQAIGELDAYLKQKQKEKNEAMQLMAKAARGINLRQSLILKEILEEPDKILTIQETRAKYNVTYQTARTDLLNLAKKGYLTSKKKRKQFLFYKSDKFDEKIESKNGTTNNY